MCTVEGCDNKILANGLCSKHYSQMRRYGKIFAYSYKDKYNHIEILKDHAEIYLINKNNEICGKMKMLSKLEIKQLISTMGNLLTKIKHIFTGTLNNLLNKNNAIAFPRLQICNKCNQRKYIFKMGHICKQCGCVLKSKATIEDEVCPLGKW